jgi:hypothetical protein
MWAFPKQPLANTDWGRLLDTLALGDMSHRAYCRYAQIGAKRGDTWEDWAFRIRSAVARYAIKRGAMF